MQKFNAKTASIVMEKCFVNADGLISDGKILQKFQRFSRAFMIYHTACEELAKYYMLEIIGRKLTHSIPINWARFWKRFRSHDSKMAQAGILAAGLSALETEENKGAAVAGASIWLTAGIVPRNRTMYVEIGADGTIIGPEDIDWRIGTLALSDLSDLLHKGTKYVGRSQGEILTQFSNPPTVDTTEVLVHTISIYRNAGMSLEETKEAIVKAWNLASTSKN